MRSTISVAIVAITLTGCATNVGGYTNSSAVEERLVGMSELQISQILGAPANEVMLSDRKAWTFIDELKGLTGGSCRVSVTIKDEKVVSAVVNASDYSFVSYPLGSCRNILRRLD
jgi:hypothetical protein